MAYVQKAVFRVISANLTTMSFRKNLQELVPSSRFFAGKPPRGHLPRKPEAELDFPLTHLANDLMVEKRSPGIRSMMMVGFHVKKSLARE